MPLPTFHFSISGSVVALYGAILATITATAQIAAHYRDRANVKMRHADIRTTMNIYGDASTSEMSVAHSKIVGLALNGR